MILIYYDKPVVIIMDEKCFSATDIFLGAFKEWRNVTLMGQPSGGGSARSVIGFLPNTKLIVRVASMASFQPNGKLYDGNGIPPDIIVDPEPSDFLEFGTDTTLEKALEWIQSQH